MHLLLVLESLLVLHLLLVLETHCIDFIIVNNNKIMGFASIYSYSISIPTEKFTPFKLIIFPYSSNN